MDQVFPDLAEKVAPAHTAVLVVDVQNDFCAAGGYYDKTGGDVRAVQQMVSRLDRFLGVARQAGARIVFVQAIYDDVYRSPAQKERHARKFGAVLPYCESGTWGAAFFQVQPAANEMVVQKHRYSAFHGTELDLVLRSQGVRTLVLTGVQTNVCVETTARDGFMRDYYIVLVDDCTAARTEELHRGALANVEMAFGVATTAEVLAGIWKAGR